ncbi:hypothetical protein GCM10025886_20710 [Tetragenococcus halophilus subsp. flandriensis]|uniref:hypothetical protein n=1 Tax=Tetragenococcus halophilus TaxID=51669 RepID=UPI000CA9D4D4|nr:hypothetical protein [Tetragenococcus halophilus]GBD64890.1 hypothetical protein TEHD23766T_2317 [Tetragenococcus halophilus subsp. flandriensis]GMA08920.1 hypothetical protein GCM10025886_20710 [Tetragenococcus halophilus subsp. flandriensis]
MIKEQKMQLIKEFKDTLEKLNLEQVEDVDFNIEEDLSGGYAISLEVSTKK